MKINFRHIRVVLSLLVVWPMFLCAQGSAERIQVFPFQVELVVPRAGDVVESYRSLYRILNPGGTAAEVSLEFFPAAGGTNPLLSKTVTVFPNQLNQAIDFGGTAANVGWVRVTSTTPVIVQQQVAHTLSILFNPPRSEFLSQLDKMPSKAGRRGFMNVRSILRSDLNQVTGVSIVAMGGSASGRLTLRNLDGGLVSTSETLVIPSNGQLLRIFTELFRPLGSESFGGTIEFNFDRPVYVTGIHFTSLPKESMAEPISGIVIE